MLEGKKILIAGAGVSGVGAAKLLGRAGYHAAVYDADRRTFCKGKRMSGPDYR